MSWDASVPTDNEAISQGASRIRTLKSDIAAALTAEGSFPVDPANPKFYPKLNKDSQANRPAASANYPGRMFLNTTTGSLQRVKDDGSDWEDVIANPAVSAIHAASAITVAAIAGVLTLTEGGNLFAASSASPVTSITGWSKGIAVVRWTSSHILTHNGASLILKNSLSRNLLAGDVSVFEFIGAGQVREIGFYGAGMGREIGEVMPFAGSTVPDGFMECDGRSLVRTDYPGLFTVLGTAHGAADGTHFNIPDLRGRFVRGWDHGAGTDPDALTRTSPRTGASSGDAVGSIQADQVIAHVHTQNGTGTHDGPGGNGQATANYSGGNTGSYGGSETRPKNVGLMYVIKF